MDRSKKQQDLVSRYKTAFLCGNQAKCSELEKTLRQTLERSFDEVKTEVAEWAKGKQASIEKATEMGKSGVERSTLEFQMFWGKIKKQNDIPLLNAVNYAYADARETGNMRNAATTETKHVNTFSPTEARAETNVPRPTVLLETKSSEAPKADGIDKKDKTSAPEFKADLHDDVTVESAASILAAIQGNPMKQSPKTREGMQDGLTLESWPDSWTKPIYSVTRKEREAKSPGQCMYQYCFYGLWDPSPEKKTKMKEQLGLYQKFGGNKAELDSETKRAESWINQARNLMNTAMKKGLTPELERKIRKMGGPLEYYVRKKLEKQQKFEQSKEIKKQHDTIISPVAPFTRDRYQMGNIPGVNLSQRTFAPLSVAHRNDITKLPPAKRWELYIDESYRKEKDGTDSFLENGNGIIGGVLFDASRPLPEQPQLHASQDASEESLLAQDKVIETLIQSPCGVLVLPVTACSGASGWASMIGTYIDLVLLLLPLLPGEAKSQVNVHIEGRAPYQSEKDCAFLRDACRFRLMQALPERASKIQLEIGVHDKSNGWNAYPDLISYTCFSKNNVSCKRLQQSGWKGTCFLNYPAEYLRNLMDIFLSGQSLDETTWNLLLEASAKNENSFITAALNAVGMEAQGKTGIWKQYLGFTVNHLNSKAIDLETLSKQLDWLTEYMPLTEELPPRLKLTWYTAKLAEANHLGEVEFDAMKEFRNLTCELYEEDAPLTCWATLHLAVNLTNAYRFAEAQQIVKDYSNIGSLLSPEPPFARLIKSTVDKISGYHPQTNYVPAAIPGLRYYGQLLSSFGQHEAFLGNPKKACLYFDEAIHCFERLSEKKDRDIDQTMAYYATALMDSEGNSEKTKSVMEKYLQGDMPSVAKRLAPDNSRKEKYHHHILLRYLVILPPGNEAVSAYLAGKSKWINDFGHPWEMIEFYRAMLLTDPLEKIARLKDAFRIAMEGGPTLHTIASVIAGSIYFLNQTEENRKEFEAISEQSIKEIPALGSGRVTALRNQLKSPVEPMSLAKTVLPFNFR